MKILQLVSCRGWSSDAYWAVRMTRELERRGHEVTLGCRRGTEDRVIDRARAEGVARVERFEFAGGARPWSDAADLRRLCIAARNTCSRSSRIVSAPGRAPSCARGTSCRPCVPTRATRGSTPGRAWS